jgi:hypothetical protein
MNNSVTVLAVVTVTVTVDFINGVVANLNSIVVDLAEFFETAEPVFKVDSITKEDFENSQGLKKQKEMINLFNNCTHHAITKRIGKHRYHIFSGSAFAAAGVARYTGFEVYCLDPDYITEGSCKYPLWAAKASRIGLYVNAEKRTDLYDLLP